MSKSDAIRHELRRLKLQYHAMKPHATRAIALGARADLEQALLDLIQMRVVDSASNSNLENAFDYPGPISSFSSRTLIAFLFGLITKEEKENLDKIRSIGNHFAHNSSGSFDDKVVKQHAQNLTLCDDWAKLIGDEKYTEAEKRFRISVAIIEMFIEERRQKMERSSTPEPLSFPLSHMQ